MSAYRDAEEFAAARRILSDPKLECIWLYRQAGLTWKEVAAKVGGHPVGLADKFRARVNAADTYATLEARALRHDAIGYKESY